MNAHETRTAIAVIEMAYSICIQ